MPLNGAEPHRPSHFSRWLPALLACVIVIACSHVSFARSLWDSASPGTALEPLQNKFRVPSPSSQEIRNRDGADCKGAVGGDDAAFEAPFTGFQWNAEESASQAGASVQGILPSPNREKDPRAPPGEHMLS